MNEEFRKVTTDQLKIPRTGYMTIDGASLLVGQFKESGSTTVVAIGDPFPPLRVLGPTVRFLDRVNNSYAFSPGKLQDIAYETAGHLREIAQPGFDPDLLDDHLKNTTHGSAISDFLKFCAARWYKDFSGDRTKLPSSETLLTQKIAFAHFPTLIKNDGVSLPKSLSTVPMQETKKQEIMRLLTLKKSQHMRDMPLALAVDHLRGFNSERFCVINDQPIIKNDKEYLDGVFFPAGYQWEEAVRFQKAGDKIALWRGKHKPTNTLKGPALVFDLGPIDEYGLYPKARLETTEILPGYEPVTRPVLAYTIGPKGRWLVSQEQFQQQYRDRLGIDNPEQLDVIAGIPWFWLLDNHLPTLAARLGEREADLGAFHIPPMLRSETNSAWFFANNPIIPAIERFLQIAA